MCCYDKILVNVATYVIPVGVCVVWSKQKPIPVYSATHKQPHLTRFCHNNTILYCILSF